MIPAFYFEKEWLDERVRRYRDRFRDAKPYQHVAMDDFVPDEIADLLCEEFPAEGVIRDVWSDDEKPLEDDHWKKQGASDESKFAPFTRHFLQQLNSGPFLRFLEELTGIPDLIPDPTFSACGLHSTARGGSLRIHSDTSRHPNPRFHQRLNLILYLNKGWKEEYGGHFELWNHTATKCEGRILPSFNRAVLFDTGATSYHGHPHPLTCPEGRRRNSVAVYYYTLDRPISPDFGGPQVVEWRSVTPDDFEVARASLREWLTPRVLVRKLAPPIVWDIVRYLRFRRERASGGPG